MMQPSVKIPKRILGTLLNSAGAGVVPRQGLEYIAIGREREIQAMLRDLENLSLGMGAFRFIVGKYGSGKSFLMGLMRANAHERKFVTADSDLTPERRFHGTHGQGLATFRELMRNLSCKAMPDGNALTSILTSWFHSLQTKGILELKLSSDSPDLTQYVQGEIFKVCNHLRGSVHGFDFAKALYSYYTGYRTLDDELQSDALRWLRGEYEGKVQSRSSRVQINSVIDDHNWYDYLKLYALFFRQIGYAGLCVFFDECVNLYKISNRVSRENNYEKILAMFNDTMQGKAEGLGFFLGATPQLIEDNRRGLFSYEALKSRLIPGKFVNSEKQNLLSPLIYLDRLTDNQIFALCKRLSILHSTYYNYTASVDDRNIASFLQLSFNRMGADEMITPREITRDFLNVLDILYSSPETSFEELVLSQDNENTKKDDDSKEDDYFDFTEIQL